LKSAWLPLALLWLAAHALLLGLILSVKFLTMKTVLVLAMAGTAVWWLVRRKPALPRLTGVV
jgi:hypothetical protein